MQTQTNNTRKLRYPTLPTEPDAPQDAYPAFDTATMNIAKHAPYRHELKPQPFTELLDAPDAAPNALRVGDFVKVIHQVSVGATVDKADENTLSVSVEQREHFSPRGTLAFAKHPHIAGANVGDKLHSTFNPNIFWVELIKVSDILLTGFIVAHSEFSHPAMRKIAPDGLVPVTFDRGKVFEVLSPEQARKELPET